MEVSTVETNTTVKGHDSSNGDVFGDKKKRKCCSRRLVIVSATIGLLCIAGIAVGIFFAAADESNTNDGTRANPTGSNHTGSEYTDLAEEQPNNDQVDLQNEQESKTSDHFIEPYLKEGIKRRYLRGCHIEQKNNFYINGRCYHMFTDHPGQKYIEDICYFSNRDVVPMDKFEILGFHKTLFQDYRMNYTADIMRYKNEILRANFDSTSAKCKAGWDVFYPNWVGLNCSLDRDYSRVCIYVTDDMVNSDDFYGLNENHDAEDVQSDI